MTGEAMGLAAAFLEQLDSAGDWGLLATDRDLTVTSWNRWLEQRSGLPAESVVGRRLFELFPDLQARRLDRYYCQALDGQTVLLSQRFHQYVLPLPPAAGGPAGSRMQQSGRIVPLTDGPAICGTLTIIEDVTERVAHEAELEAHARQQAALAATARSALVGGDLGDLARELLARVAESLGTDLGEVLELRPDSRSWQPLAADGWAEPPAPIVEFAAAPRTVPSLHDDDALAVEDVPSEPRFAADARLRSHNVASGLFVRVPGPGHRPYGMVGAYTRGRRRFTAGETQFVQSLADILGVAAERKRLEDQLRLRAGELVEADRRKDEFLAMLAHELRNPLAPTLNALQLLRLGGIDPGTAEQARDMAERQVRHMARLIDDLLDVSRISSGKVTLQTEPLNLATLATRAVESVRPFMESRGHQLTVTLPPRQVAVNADPTRLEQVLANLLNNAAKYTDPGGHVVLTVTQEGANAVVAVRDNGVGIVPELLPRVFDLFTQADRSLDRSQGGLGIGLTMVKQLVELHGGTVAARSAGPGHGSEFTARLPALPAAELDARLAKDPAAPAGPLRILIVDDNKDAAHSLALLLRATGHATSAAYDGREAVEAAARDRPEVVLLDIGLPVMDGYAVARRLREDNAGARMLIVALTGYGQDEDRRLAREAGFDGHLVKPVDLDALNAILATRRAE